jgi:hypothetical protein
MTICKCVDDKRKKRCTNQAGPDGYCWYCTRMYPCDHATAHPADAPVYASKAPEWDDGLGDL